MSCGASRTILFGKSKSWSTAMHMTEYAYSDYVARFGKWTWDPYDYNIRQVILIGDDDLDQNY